MYIGPAQAHRGHAFMLIAALGAGTRIMAAAAYRELAPLLMRIHAAAPKTCGCLRQCISLC